MVKSKTFADYRAEAHLWITLSTGDYYPDVLPLACELYQPVLVTFGQLLKSSHSSTDLFLAICQTNPQWMRIQLCRVFRKYVSPETPVEMLKKKSARNAKKEVGCSKNLSAIWSRISTNYRSSSPV